MRTFKNFVNKFAWRKDDVEHHNDKKKDRSDKFVWKKGDVEHHDKSRQGKFTWGPNDVEHHGKVNESLDEKVKLPTDAKGNFGNPVHIETRHGLEAHTHPIRKKGYEPEESREAFAEHHDNLDSDEMDSLRHYKASGYSDINKHLRTAPNKFKKERAEHFKKKAAAASKLKFVGSESDPHKTLHNAKNNIEPRSRRDDDDHHDHDDDDDYYIENHIHHLDNVTGHRTKEHLTVFRGGTPGDKTRYPVGHEFTDHGYTSTSFSPSIAKSFSKSHKVTSSKDSVPKYKSHIHIIHVPKGSRGHWFDVHGDDSDHSHSHENEFVLQRGTRFKVTHHSEDEHGNHFIHSRVVKQGIRPNFSMKKMQNSADKPKDNHGLPGQNKFPFMKHHERFKAK